jgi:proteic killer suppression protein
VRHLDWDSLTSLTASFVGADFGECKGINPDHAQRLSRILDRLNAACEIKNMNYPGSFLHQLSGNKKGFHAVRVSGNWRVFFKFVDSDAYDIDYDDYH